MKWPAPSKRLFESLKPLVIRGTRGGPSPSMQSRNRSITAASVLFVFTGSAFLLSGIPVLLYMIENRDLPIFFGIQASSGGFIEPLGIDALIAAQVVLIVTSAVELAAGYWLWKGRRRGGVLAFGLLPVSMVVGVGLLLPGIIAIAPVRILLLIAGWKTLS